MTRPEQLSLDLDARQAPDRDDIVYAAGFFDGEGCVNLTRGSATNRGTVRTAGFITYPGPGQVALTTHGRAQAHEDIDIPTTSEGLHRQLYSRLSGPQVRILQQLIKLYPESIDKAELAEKAEASATSSAFTNNLGALRSLGLIDYPSPGQVTALPVLFLEEAAVR